MNSTCIQCMICHMAYSGKFFWNIHKNESPEDRHLLCNKCMIQYADNYMECPLKCKNKCDPHKLNKGYAEAITLVNAMYKGEYTPDAQSVESMELFDKIIEDPDRYLSKDGDGYILYSDKAFKTMTQYLTTLRTKGFENGIKCVMKFNEENPELSDCCIKLGKRKVEEQVAPPPKRMRLPGSASGLRRQ